MTQSILKKWRRLGIVLVALIVGVVGCPETQQMMQPVVSEPADTTPPVMVGEVKEEAEETEQEETAAAEQPAEEVTDPTPPADTTPPTVVEVAWYGDEQMTQVLTANSTVQPEDTIYTVVKFSEPVVHVVANDNTARPDLFIVIDGMAERYKMLAHGANLRSGEAQPLNGNTDEYLCKYTVPADIIGTLALRVGGGTVDTAGNSVVEVSEHIAPFVVTAPEPEQASLTLPPGYTLPAELIPAEPTVLSADEQAMLDNVTLVGLDGTAVRSHTTNSTADLISLLPFRDREEVYDLFVASVNLPFFAEAAEKMKEVNIRLGILNQEYWKTGDGTQYWTYRQSAEEERGITGWGVSNYLETIYFEENPQESQHRDGCSHYWMILEWYRLQFEYPNLHTFIEVGEPWALLEHYRKSAREGRVFGLDNPWN